MAYIAGHMEAQKPAPVEVALADYTVMSDVRAVQRLPIEIAKVFYKDGTGWEIKLERCGTGGFVPEGSILKENVSIDRTSVVFDCNSIQPGVKVVNSIVGREVTIGWYSTVRNSRIGRGTKIGYNTKINDTIIDASLTKVNDTIKYAGAMIGDNVVVGKRHSGTITKLGSGCALLDNSVVEWGCYVGKSTVYPYVTVHHDSNIGDGHDLQKNVPPFKVLVSTSLQKSAAAQ